MSKNIANLRFAISDGKYGHSGVWRLWVTKHADIYLATKDMAGKIKVSFHKSGICRYAFTTEHANARQIEDRLIHKWLRPNVPAKGMNQFARLGVIAFPTNYLSPVDSVGAATKRVPAADLSGTTVIEIGLTREPEDAIGATPDVTFKWGILLWAPFSADVNFFVRWYHSQEVIGDMSMPASHGLPGYRFVYPELEQPDRPVRFHMQNNPDDHNTLSIIERSGCKINSV